MGNNYGHGKIVTDGLILAYDAADTNSYPGSGTTWNNLTSKTDNATLINGPTYNPGNAGYISFDGVNDRISGPTGVTWFTNTSFTIEGWFNFDSSPPSQQIWFSANLNGGGGNQDIHLRVINGTTLRFGFYGDDLDANGVVSHSNWYNAVYWYDYPTDNARIYVNGNQVASNSSGPFIQSSANIGIGYWISRNTQYFKGDIATTRVYTRALSDEEILQNYNAQKTRFN